MIETITIIDGPCQIEGITRGFVAFFPLITKLAVIISGIMEMTDINNYGISVLIASLLAVN